jgi:hypothetical protein
VRLTPPGAGTTFQSRLRQYQRRGSLLLWVGAGLGGLIVLVTSNLDAGAPKVFNGLLTLAVIVSGGSLAEARVGYEWAATQLERKMTDEKIDETTQLPTDLAGWPTFSEACWIIGRNAAMVAALVYVIAVWYAVLG